MARGTKSKNSQPLTTAQRLSSIVKSCRDIMRKDKGLNGDLDRLPMLTWVMFLKFLDDMEQIREEEAKMSGKRFRPALESPYRWRDWAAKPEGITGDEMIAFVNNEEAVRPDSTKGPGLFAYLRGLQGANGGDRRDVIATVFKGTINRMINGYLLRDVINKVSDIHFTSSDEIHTLGHLYESMLKKMRDAAGDSEKRIKGVGSLFTSPSRTYDYDELINRDKASLDIFWLTYESLEESDNLPGPDVLTQEIVEDLEAALEQFREIVAQEWWLACWS